MGERNSFSECWVQRVIHDDCFGWFSGFCLVDMEKKERNYCCCWYSTSRCSSYSSTATPLYLQLISVSLSLSLTASSVVYSNFV